MQRRVRRGEGLAISRSAVGLALVCVALTACAKPYRAPVYGPVRSEAMALEVAERALGNHSSLQGAPLRAVQKGEAWIVVAGPIPYRNGTISQAVTIDAKTGRTEVTTYQVAQVNVKL